MQKIKALKKLYIKAKFLNEFCIQTLKTGSKLENNRIKSNFQIKDKFCNNEISNEIQKKDDIDNLNEIGEDKIIGIEDFKKLFRESNIFLIALKNFWIEKEKNKKKSFDKKKGLEFIRQSICEYLLKKDIKLDDLQTLQNYHEVLQKDIEESLPFESNILATLFKFRDYVFSIKNSRKIMFPSSSYLSILPSLLPSVFSLLPSSSVSSALSLLSSPYYPPKMSPFYPEAINLFLFEFQMEMWLERLNLLKIKPISYKFFFELALEWDDLERMLNKKDEKQSQNDRPNYLEKIKFDPLITQQITNFKQTRLKIELLLSFEKELDFYQTSKTPINNPSEFSSLLIKNENIYIESGVDLPSLHSKLNFFSNISTAAVKAEKLMSLFSMKSRQLNLDFFLVLNRFAIKYELHQMFPIFHQISNIILKVTRIKCLIKRISIASRKKEKEFFSKKIGLSEKRKVLEKLEDGLVFNPRLFFYQEIYDFYQKMPDYPTIMNSIKDLEELNLNLTLERKTLITFKKSTEVFGKLFETFEESFPIEKAGGSLVDEFLSDLIDLKNKLVASTLLNCIAIPKMRELEIKFWSILLLEGHICLLQGFFIQLEKKEVDQEEGEYEKDDKNKNRKRVLQEIRDQLNDLKGKDNDNDCDDIFGMNDVSLALEIEKECQDCDLKKKIRGKIDYLENLREELRNNLKIYSKIQEKKEVLLKKLESVVSIKEIEIGLTEIQDLRKNLLRSDLFNVYKSTYLENKFYDKEINHNLCLIINQKKGMEGSFKMFVDSIKNIKLKQIKEFRKKLNRILFESYFSDVEVIPLGIELSILALFSIFFKIVESFNFKKSEIKLNLLKRFNQIFSVQIESLDNLLKSVQTERTFLISQTAKLYNNLEIHKKHDKKQELIEEKLKILNNLEIDLNNKVHININSLTNIKIDLL